MGTCRGDVPGWVRDGSTGESRRRNQSRDLETEDVEVCVVRVKTFIGTRESVVQDVDPTGNVGRGGTWTNIEVTWHRDSGFRTLYGRTVETSCLYERTGTDEETRGQGGSAEDSRRSVRTRRHSQTGVVRRVPVNGSLPRGSGRLRRVGRPFTWILDTSSGSDGEEHEGNSSIIKCVWRVRIFERNFQTRSLL